MRGPIDPLLRAVPTVRNDLDIAALFGEHRRLVLGIAAAYVPEFPPPGATIRIPPGWTDPDTATAG